jgi:hypothetical protein
MPTTIDSAGITFNDATSLTSANGVPSALKLTTARTINGVSFDGTANITVPATASGANVAKAWVNFNGTTSPGTIRSSYNVSSVTKNGTGDYTVNFSTPMTDVNYTAQGSINSFDTGAGLCFFHTLWGSQTINAFYCKTANYNNGANDALWVTVAFFGN